MNIDESKKMYEKAISLRDNNPLEAIKELSKVIELGAAGDKVFAERGLCYLDIKKYDLAIDDFTIAIRRANKNRNLALYYELIARAFYRKNDMPNALINLKKSCNLYPTSAFESRGKIYFELKKYELAKLDFIKMIEFDPMNGVRYFKVGQCLYHIGDQKEALDYFIKARDLGYSDAQKLVLFLTNSERKDIYDKAFPLFKSGKYKEALPLYLRLAQLIPSEGDLFWKAGWCYYELKQIPEAINCLEHAHSLGIDAAMPVIKLIKGKKK